MKKKIFLLGLMASAMTMVAQESKKNESWYFKLGGSYFTQTAATEFPTVDGNLPNTEVYQAGVLVSKETNHGSFGEGFRTSLNIGYRFSTHLGAEMGINYFTGNSKTMVESTNVIAGPFFTTAKAEGKIRALDLAPALVLFLGETKGFEPYTKVGVIIPIVGDLTIETNKTISLPTGTTNTHAKDVVKPNPTLGFMAALGTSYKLGKNISVFGELEYRNFTVHGKSKETTEYTENGIDKLNTPTTFRPDASYSASHVNYVDQINSSSNNHSFNPNNSTPYKYDTTRPNEAKDDISSYVGISGLGLTLGLRYHL
ncbi:outer membrane beta-barrel protein [Flavobacterium psychrophilum]